MNEYELMDIWKKNLREYHDVMRLDSLIVRAMQEVQHIAHKKGYEEGANAAANDILG